jgi:diguanylate cyclase (GGDEF)-like protein
MARKQGEPHDDRPIGLVRLGDAAAPLSYRIGTAIVAVFLFLLGTLAATHGRDAMPIVPSFLPMVTTLCIVAYTITAFFLLVQFSVTGIWVYMGIAAAYALCGLLSIPSLAIPPFVVRSHDAVIEHVATAIWAASFLFFPLVIVGCSLVDPTLSRRIAPCASVRGLVSKITIVVVGAVVLTGVAVVVFQRLVPVNIVAFSGCAGGLVALVVLWARSPKKTILTLLLSISVLSSALDGLMLVATKAPYDLGWYTGKFSALLAAAVVLIVLLGEAMRIHRKLVRIASSDVLTGLSNRRSADEYLAQTIERMHARGGSVALFVIDVDDFKAYNDCYGHVAGDLAVRTVADTLRACVSRPADLVTRYGGEEFVVVLPDCTLIGAEVIAERMRACVEELAIVHAASRVGPCLTVSIGVGHSGETTMAAGPLFELADKALYRAKDSGRNRCAVGTFERTTPVFHIISAMHDRIAFGESLSHAAS